MEKFLVVRASVLSNLVWFWKVWCSSVVAPPLILRSTISYCIFLSLELLIFIGIIGHHSFGCQLMNASVSQVLIPNWGLILVLTCIRSKWFSAENLCTIVYPTRVILCILYNGWNQWDFVPPFFSRRSFVGKILPKDKL